MCIRDRFVADISRRTVRASQLPELSALGAVLAAMIGMQGATLSDLQRLPAGYDTYEPRMAEATAVQFYAGWQHAVQQVLV